jgi:hypothetical protein
VSANGHQLWFFSRIVARMPDNLVCDLIAHELAHVYLKAVGAEFLDQSEEELEADLLMERLGFDADAMDTWALEQGIIRVRLVSQKEWLRRLAMYR